MEVINHFDTMDESTDENIMSDDTVGVVLEEAEIVDCDAEAEAEVDDENVQYHLYAVNRGDSTVAYQVMQVSNASRENNEVPIATPVNNAVQVLASSNGQLYVLSNNADVVTSDTARSVAPRVGKLQIERSSQNIITGIKKRDERRRVTHNEVERRRRDKINNWISKLGKLLPDCDQNTNGEVDTKVSFESQSKGDILARTCNYITKLRKDQEKLIHSLEENAQLTEEVKNLQQIVNDLRSENSTLKVQITKENVFVLSS